MLSQKGSEKKKKKKKRNLPMMKKAVSPCLERNAIRHSAAAAADRTIRMPSSDRKTKQSAAGKPV
jgi:hypothetical protein